MSTSAATPLAKVPDAVWPGGSPPGYERRRPEQGTLHRVVRENLLTLLAAAEQGFAGAPLPDFVRGDDKPVFHALPRISDVAVADLLSVIRARLLRYLVRRRVVEGEAEGETRFLADDLG